MKNVIYHAYFVNNPASLRAMFAAIHPNTFYHHATIAFKPKNTNDIQLGRQTQLNVRGYLITDKVHCLVISGDKLTKEFPHITLSTAEGVKPAQCNDELKEHSDKIVWFGEDCPSVNCTEGYFNGKDIKG